MVEILVLLYYQYMDIDPANPDKPDRDRFVLSKGHGGIGYAPGFCCKKYFQDKEIVQA